MVLWFDEPAGADLEAAGVGQAVLLPERHVHGLFVKGKQQVHVPHLQE